MSSMLTFLAVLTSYLIDGIEIMILWVMVEGFIVKYLKDGPLMKL